MWGRCCCMWGVCVCVCLCVYMHGCVCVHGVCVCVCGGCRKPVLSQLDAAHLQGSADTEI